MSDRHDPIRLAPPGPGAIPGYTIVREVGRGGFAVVYEARQTSLDRPVALKVLTAFDLDERLVDRFLRESHAMAALDWHPHIVSVYDAGVAPDTRAPYLVMEYLSAGSLMDRVEHDGPLAWPDVVAVGTQLAQALQAAHDIGIVHRDVKPENVLVHRTGDVKLSDFGIASIANLHASATGGLSGTPAHSAPEVIGGGRATPRSDVYSLGSTLYTLLAGRPAFHRPTDESAVQVAVRVLQEPLPDLRPLGVPDAIAGAVEVLMDRDPEARPTSAAAAGDLLLAASRRATLPISAVPTRAAQAFDTLAVLPVVTPPPDRRRTGRRVAGAAVAAAVAIAALVVAATTGGGGEGSSVTTVRAAATASTAAAAPSATADPPTASTAAPTTGPSATAPPTSAPTTTATTVAPTTVPPTTAPPTTEPPTTAPPSTAPPTTAPPTTAPPTTAPPTTAPPLAPLRTPSDLTLTVGVLNDPCTNPGATAFAAGPCHVIIVAWTGQDDPTVRYSLVPQPFAPGGPTTLPIGPANYDHTGDRYTVNFAMRPGANACVAVRALRADDSGRTTDSTDATTACVTTP